MLTVIVVKLAFCDLYEERLELYVYIYKTLKFIFVYYLDPFHFFSTRIYHFLSNHTI